MNNTVKRTAYKITAIAVTAILTLCIFKSMPANAAEVSNTVKFFSLAPKIDGKVSEEEWGKPVFTVKEGEPNINIIKKDNVKSNFIFQMFYQIVTLAIPLIIAPYLTRTLGDSSLGIYTFTYSIMSCFMTIARLGIDKHGQRVIAAATDDEKKLRVTFWSLYVTHIFFTMVAVILYFGFVVFFAKKYYSVYLIQGLALFGVMFDITWLFYGIENFKLIVLENLCVKISELLLIFNFVKNKNSLEIYTCIMSLSLCLGYLVVLPYAIKKLKPIKFSWNDVKQHLKPLFILFFAAIAVTAYQMIDKTLLGLLSTESNVAYYEYTNKIVNVPVNLVYVTGTVLMPRACAYAAKGDKKNQIKYMNYSLHFVCFLGIGAAFGFWSVSNLFSSVYYGKSFADCGGVMMALCPVIFLLGIENIMRTQYMIPNHMDKQFTGCIVITTIINLILSAILIPVIGVYGAVIGTIVAELVCTIVQIILCRSTLSIRKIVKTAVPYLISGLIMLCVIRIVKINYNHSIWHLLLQIVIGGGCYCVYAGSYLLFFSGIKNRR